MEIVDDISIEPNVPFRVERHDAAVACGISYDFPGRLVFDGVERRRATYRDAATV
jgi:hypothetical protein